MSAQRLLDPINPPLVAFGPTRAAQTTLTFSVKAVGGKVRSAASGLTQDTFDVLDDSRVLFHATAGGLRLKNITRITDITGAGLCNITASYQGSLQRAFTGMDAEGTVFRAEKKWSWGTKLVVSSPGLQHTLVVLGYGLMRSAEVTMDGQVLAVFEREGWGRGLMWNSKSDGRADILYRLTVAAGVDLALMTALCIIFDECKFDDAKHG
ncbi:unnamed protein product [Cutaneotrichosporon oleaginosum]